MREANKCGENKISEMSKKIGLVAVTNHNFGSILQTYALQCAVRSMGCDTQIIQYSEGKSAKIRRFKNKEYAISRLKMIYKKVAMNILYPKQKHLLAERAEAFRRFIDNELTFSKLCTSKGALSKLSKNYDKIVLGSDQVWHPMNLLMDFFTLNFVPDSIMKGAYAPSFGVSVIPESYKPAYKAYINRIEHVSCREIAGVNLIKNLVGRDVPMVCDPTLLLAANDWEPCLSDKVKYNEKYVFCYFIGDNPNQRKVIQDYAKKHGYKIVALLHIDEYVESDENYADYTPYNVGPAEFLYLVKNAECVMTDSFHASVFSLQFHRNFYTFNRFENGKGNSTSSRIDSLLGTVELMDRKVKNGATMTDLSEKPIDYTKVDGVLAQFRASSVEYLRSIIEA